jgi:hypothetical protein
MTAEREALRQCRDAGDRMRAWHFVGDTLRDGSPVPPDGVKLVHSGKVVPCESGLHASAHPFDALRYAPGPVLCLVEVGGTIVEHGNPVDKVACSERTIITRMDATPLLRYFARQQALSVVHLWDPPQVMLDYLMGDDAARAAARDAAWDAPMDAARAAAWAAARAAAMDATWAAARAAATDAATDAAWDAVWAAARDDFAALVNEAFEDWL